MVSSFKWCLHQAIQLCYIVIFFIIISPKETLKHNLNSMTQKLMTNTDFSISFPNGECFACIRWENILQNPQLSNDQKVSLN